MGFSSLFSGWKGIFNPSVPAVIASGQSTSSSVQGDGLALAGVQLPAAFTGTSLSFLVATTNAGPWQPLYNSSGLVSYAVAQGRYIAINPIDFAGAPWFQIVSNASEAASRTLVCSMKGL